MGHRRKSLNQRVRMEDGDRGGSAQTQKNSYREEKEKTNLTHTGLLMEGLGYFDFSWELPWKYDSPKTKLRKLILP